MGGPLSHTTNRHAERQRTWVLALEALGGEAKRLRLKQACGRWAQEGGVLGGQQECKDTFPKPPRVAFSCWVALATEDTHGHFLLRMRAAAPSGFSVVQPVAPRPGRAKGGEETPS